MARSISTVLALSALGLSLAGPAAAQGGAFYGGKELTIVVNFAAGGPTDIEGRVFARHLASHIEGRPTVVVMNKEGAGGLVGALYMGEVGPKDGRMAGYFAGSAWNAVNLPERFAMPYKRYEFVAYYSGTTVYYARADTPPGLKRPADLANVIEMVAAGQSVDNVKDLLHRLTLDMLGVRYRYVTGYQSSSAARLAMQRGEIHFYSEGPPSYLGVIEPQLVRTGEVLPLYYDPQYDAGRLMIAPSVAALPVLPFQELHRQIKGALPAGPLWEAYLAVLAANQTAQRIFTLPPGAPAAAVAALRAAVGALNEDEAFRAEALRTIGFAPVYQTGPDTSARVAALLDGMRPDTLAFIRAYVKGAQR